MIWQASRPTATFMRRVRFGLLAVVALFLAHDAVFLAQFGVGDGFAVAMQRSGHDVYWPAYMLLVGSAAAALATITLLRVARLRLQLTAHVASRPETPEVPRPRARAAAAPSYRRELAGLWVRLLVVVVVGFVLQENLEHAGHSHVPGIGVLFGPENPLAVPALAAVTLLLAMAGALVRWRIAVLDAQVARAVAAGSPRARKTATRPAAGAWIAAAVCAHHWTIARQDPGRAPPLVPRVA